MTTPHDRSRRASAARPSAKEADSGDTGRYSIASIGRALDMIEAMVRIGPASLADLAAEAHCTRTAGFRLLRTLQERGFAIQDHARGAWRLGARWNSVGHAASAQGALAAAAQPYLETLGLVTGETAYLCARAGFECETIAEYRPDEMLPRFARIGERRPLHAGPGRLLLAFAPEAVQAHVLAQRLPRYTPATPVDPRAIAADLRRLRNRAGSVFSAETQLGVIAIAAPVRDGLGEVVAVLHMSAAAHRIRAQRLGALQADVVRAAADLSAALGYRPAATAAKQPAPA